MDHKKARKTSNMDIITRTNYRWYYNDLKRSCKSIGIDLKDFSTHDFRRAFAEDVWKLTHDPRQLKEALHHKRFETTQIYLQRSGLENKDLQYKLHQTQ